MRPVRDIQGPSKHLPYEVNVESCAITQIQARLNADLGVQL